jgi:ketosteroid isomerase-like protein
MSPARADVLRRYFAALSAGDTAAVLALFSPDGIVVSPFLGSLPATEFFARLAAATSDSRVSLLDATHGETTSAGRFNYEWTLADGTTVSFEGVDHFTFDGAGRVAALRIYYDTHPLRAQVGDKYA